MMENKYKVLVDEEIIAENMTIEYATLLVEAIAKKRWQLLRVGGMVGIREMELAVDTEAKSCEWKENGGWR